MRPASEYRYLRREVADPLYEVMGNLRQFLQWHDDQLCHSDALVLEGARQVLQDVTTYLIKWLNMRAIEIEAEDYHRD